SQASGPTPRRLARSAAPGARLRADLQRLARRGRERRCLPTLLSAQRAFGDGPFLLLGARSGHPEAQNAPEPAREAQNGVDSRSGILQTPKELVESPFPLRNQTWKETFCSWTENQIPIPIPKLVGLISSDPSSLVLIFVMAVPLSWCATWLLAARYRAAIKRLMIAKAPPLGLATASSLTPPPLEAEGAYLMLPSAWAATGGQAGC